MPGLDVETIRHALKTAREHGFVKVRIEANSDRFDAVLGEASPRVEHSANGSLQQIAGHLDRAVVESPLVGFWSESHLAVGMPVREGDLLGVVSAVGLPHEVRSNCSGMVEEVLVELGDAVEFGQAVAYVRREP